MIKDEISIHAPREGSDQLTTHATRSQSCISIHAPREGSDSEALGVDVEWDDFNPRSP